MPVQLNSCPEIRVYEQLFRWPLVRIWVTGYTKAIRHWSERNCVIGIAAQKSPAVFTCGVSVFQVLRSTKAVLGGL
jgi:hypothetical protein